MDQNLLEALLNEEEDSSLDFKREQYLFDGADDRAKSELLKDILAFANGWRRVDAYLLIGVEEVRGGRSLPVGVTTHLADASLQQFVNSKLQKPLDFSYEVVAVAGVEIGVIRVPHGQLRPFYLTKDFGNLQKNVVYVRRGSSTDTADPSEIARMGALSTPVEIPQLSVVARRAEGSGLRLVVSLNNAPEAGPARAPRLGIQVLGPFALCIYGLDGNGNDGLPRLAQSGDSPFIVFAGDANFSIPANVTHDVVCMECRGEPDRWPRSHDIPYELSADGMKLKKDTLKVPCS